MRDGGVSSGNAGCDFFGARVMRQFVDRVGFDHVGGRLFVNSLAGPKTRRERRVLVARNLDRVLDEQPATLRAGHRALDEEQTALGVGTHDLEILLRAIAVTHLTGHLLVLENLARILALASRAERTVRNRDAVRSAQALEAPPLHAA